MSWTIFNIADNEAEEKDLFQTENSLHFDVHHCAVSEQEIWHLTVSVAVYLHNYHLFLLTETNSYDAIVKNVMNSAIAWFKLVVKYIQPDTSVHYSDRPHTNFIVHCLLGCNCGVVITRIFIADCNESCQATSSSIQISS